MTTKEKIQALEDYKYILASGQYKQGRLTQLVNKIDRLQHEIEQETQQEKPEENPTERQLKMYVQLVTELSTLLEEEKQRQELKTMIATTNAINLSTTFEIIQTQWNQLKELKHQIKTCEATLAEAENEILKHRTQ